MNEFQAYEYTVKPRCDRALLVKRICLIVSYALLAVLVLALGVVTRIFVPLIALLPISIWVFVYFTWRYVDVEFEISVTSGVLTVSKIYGRRSRKTVFEAPIKVMSTIAPYTDENAEKIERFAPKISYSALSSSNSENAYFALFETEEEEKAIFIFDTDGEGGKILKIFKFYNSVAFSR